MTSHLPPQSKGSETTTRILAAARDVFSENGFDAARVDEIARRAGVNKATLYYHIGNKETLYEKVLLGVMSRVIDAAARDIQDAPSPEEKLRTYIQNVALAVDRNPWMPPIMLREMASGGRNLPEAVVAGMVRIFTILGGIIEEGVRQGVFMASAPPLVHFMIMGALVFYKTSAPVRARTESLPEVWQDRGEQVSHEIAADVAGLIIGALKKGTGKNRTYHEARP